MDEYKLLIYLLEYCEENGKRYKHYDIDINSELIEKLHNKYGIQPTIEELQSISDRCYARSWLEHTYIGRGKYDGLKLTDTGAGVATSKRKSLQANQNRPPLKKASDYIEDHKGLFVLLCTLIAIVGLIKTFSSSNGAS